MSQLPKNTGPYTLLREYHRHFIHPNRCHLVQDHQQKWILFLPLTSRVNPSPPNSSILHATRSRDFCSVVPTRKVYDLHRHFLTAVALLSLLLTLRYISTIYPCVTNLDALNAILTLYQSDLTPMLVVADLDEVFVPLKRGIFVDPRERK